jgi:hypothetical protein
VHPPPAQLAGFVASLAAPLCFDAAYDAPGTATIAANAIAATRLIFEVIEGLPEGSIMATEMSALSLTPCRATCGGAYEHAMNLREKLPRNLSETPILLADRPKT